jgi:peroxiredoxin
MILTKTMNKVMVIILAVVLAAGVLTLAGCSGSSNSNNGKLNIDSPAPDFKLTDINGQSVSLSSYQGKNVLINFWAISCAPCVEEMPYLQAIHNDTSAKGNLVILMINAGEDQTTVKSFIQTNKYTFPVLIDKQLDVAEKYYIQYTPTTVLIDKQGLIKFNIVGAFKNQAAIEKQLAGYLN